MRLCSLFLPVCVLLFSLQTVTVEPHPFLGVAHASIHPCKHAHVMKRIVDQMQSYQASEGTNATAHKVDVKQSDTRDQGLRGTAKPRVRDSHRSYFLSLSLISPSLLQVHVHLPQVHLVCDPNNRVRLLPVGPARRTSQPAAAGRSHRIARSHRTLERTGTIAHAIAQHVHM